MNEPQSELASIADRLLHLHAHLDLLASRALLELQRAGAERELRDIRDELLDLHSRLHIVIDSLAPDQI